MPIRPSGPPAEADPLKAQPMADRCILAALQPLMNRPFLQNGIRAHGSVRFPPDKVRAGLFSHPMKTGPWGRVAVISG